MAKFSISEVIEQAVQTEKLGAGFYSDMAGRFEKNKKLNRLFRTFADMESAHELKFTEIKNIVKDEKIEGWEEVSQYLRAIVESAFFLGKGKSLTAMRNIRTETDALNYALGFEKETLLYYLGIREHIKGKKAINEIIKEEKSHIILLDKLKKSL